MSDRSKVFAPRPLEKRLVPVLVRCDELLDSEADRLRAAGGGLDEVEPYLKIRRQALLQAMACREDEVIGNQNTAADRLQPACDSDRDHRLGVPVQPLVAPRRVIVVLPIDRLELLANLGRGTHGLATQPGIATGDRLTVEGRQLVLGPALLLGDG